MLKPKLVTFLPGYTRSFFMSDLLAGVTVGIIALPLAMAFAIASGLPPEKGIFTAIVAGFLISALGGSRVQIGGPTGAFVVIVSGIVAKFGYSGLVYCTLLAGLFLIAFGFLRMGGMIKFIPFPVTTGFTTGIAVVIFSTQIKDLLGLSMPAPPVEFLPKWASYIRCLPGLDPAAAALGIGTVLIIVVSRRFFPKLPAMLIGLAVTTLIASLFHFQVETIGSRFGDLPKSLPLPSIPAMDFSRLHELVSPAFTVALLAAIESLLSATVADGMTGGRHRPNMELVAQGTANIASVFFGGIPATGAIARTATNIKSGAKTPVSGVIHALVLTVMLFFISPLAKRVPLAALAGVLVVVSYNMSETKHFRSLLKAPRSDVMVLLATFMLTVFVDLTVAVEVGVIMSALLFIRRMSEVANIGMITREVRGDEEESEDPNAIHLRRVPAGVEVFEIQGPFFFGAAERFRDSVNVLKKNLKVIILRVRQVSAIDATGSMSCGGSINVAGEMDSL